jgi:hypothetical protein
MKEKLTSFFNGILGSFSNDTTGYSGKKLTALAITACVVAAHIKWLSIGNLSQLEMVLTIDYAFIATLFGINVIDKKQNPMEQHSPDEPKQEPPAP